MFYNSLQVLLANNPILTLFGRSGGGGSSSGGGGESILVLLGYVPMHFFGAIFRKVMPLWLASLIGWSVSVIYAGVWILSGISFGVFIAVAAIVGMGAGLYNWFDKIAKLSNIAKKKQVLALAKDSAWDMALLNKQTSDIFSKYQIDWSNNDSAAMQNYLTPYYLYHNQLMVLAIQQLGRRNLVSQPVISKIDLVDVVDSDDNTKDSFTMLISARAVDELYDLKTNTLIFSDKRPFKEYWRFIRKDSLSWLLDGITQNTEEISMRNNVIASFAKSHDYCFSVDWGWLLLPGRGQLFGSGKFGTSDINNHVIGVYNNTLIQLYNYVPNPKKYSDNYIIAQVALPKSYGNIVVRKKRNSPFSNIKGLTRITLEWGDFNKRYEVWASDMERVTSFELLNPSFMVKLQELPFEVNIEVVDNIVYLYSAKTEALAKTYETMLAILYQAFKEMRM